MSRTGKASTWPYRLRRLHLYLGALFAPALLFFAFSGALQEFGLQDPRPDGYRPAAWVAQLAAVHKHQTMKPPADAKRKSVGGGAIKVAPPTPATTAVLRVFFCAASAGLIGSTLIGLYLALRFSRRPRVILALAGAGVLIPLLLLLA